MTILEAVTYLLSGDSRVDLAQTTAHWCEDRDPYAPNGCREREVAKNSQIPDPEQHVLCRIDCTAENCDCTCINKP